MQQGKILLQDQRFALTIERLCHQLMEDLGDLSNVCLIGIQQGGVALSARIHERLLELSGLPAIVYSRVVCVCCGRGYFDLPVPI
jgi:pyrimidine operon attenuation protein/uracil phosphoribosyltransferase